MSSSLIRYGGLASMVGGALWAITPLREPLLGGRFPGDPVFRPYNLVLVIIAVLLAVGLLAFRARYKGSYGRLGTAGVFVIFGGYALMFFGSLPAVLFSPKGLRGLITLGQDLGFLGALVELVGALLLGIALWRSGAASGLGSLLLIVALPVGILGVIVLSAMGFEDAAGLPWTVLYGGAWIALGSLLLSQRGEQAARRPSRAVS